MLSGEIVNLFSLRSRTGYDFIFICFTQHYSGVPGWCNKPRKIKDIKFEKGHVKLLLLADAIKF